jgi:hypothetical protein
MEKLEIGDGLSDREIIHKYMVEYDRSSSAKLKRLDQIEKRRDYAKQQLDLATRLLFKFCPDPSTRLRKLESKIPNETRHLDQLTSHLRDTTRSQESTHTLSEQKTTATRELTAHKRELYILKTHITAERRAEQNLEYFTSQFQLLFTQMMQKHDEFKQNQDNPDKAALAAMLRSNPPEL